MNAYIRESDTEEQLSYWFGVVSVLILLAVNLPLLWIVKRTWNLSMINKLIGLDCLVALLNILFILKAANIISSPCWMRRNTNLSQMTKKFIICFSKLKKVSLYTMTGSSTNPNFGFESISLFFSIRPHFRPFLNFFVSLWGYFFSPFGLLFGLVSG